MRSWNLFLSLGFWSFDTLPSSTMSNDFNENVKLVKMNVNNYFQRGSHCFHHEVTAEVISGWFHLLPLFFCLLSPCTQTHTLAHSAVTCGSRATEVEMMFINQSNSVYACADMDVCYWCREECHRGQFNCDCVCSGFTARSAALSDTRLFNTHLNSTSIISPIIAQTTLNTVEDVDLGAGSLVSVRMWFNT